MKALVTLLSLVGMISLIGGREVAAEQSLQAQINATKESGTLKLKAGTYQEPIVLTKPIVLEGEKGTILHSCSSKSAITIKGNHVTVKGITIVSCENDKSPAAISISGNNHHLEDITLNIKKIGIKLENATKTSFQHITIAGNRNGNGVDLWESHQNRFEDVTIHHVEDGFYMENSHGNTFVANTIHDSRYGLHIMFSDNITAIGNRSTKNFTGAMVMGTSHSVLKDNQLRENNQNVNAQGLLLYDVHDSKISNNDISANRVGLMMEESSGNKITNNKFMANFVGAQMNRIEKNIISDNTFISNVTDFQAKDGTNNTIQKNYWDSALKLDTDGDERSNLPHRADPFFLNLAAETPPYQLFFQHPGMMLLQKMLKSPDHLLVTDKEPLMKNNLTASAPKQPQNEIYWIMSLFMIFSSLYIIYLGRKKR